MFHFTDFRIKWRGTWGDDMEKELQDLQPVLATLTKENQEQMVIIEKNSKDAAVTKAIVQEEEKSEIGKKVWECTQQCEPRW